MYAYTSCHKPNIPFVKELEDSLTVITNAHKCTLFQANSVHFFTVYFQINFNNYPPFYITVSHVVSFHEIL